MTQSGHRKKRHRSSGREEIGALTGGSGPLAFAEDEIVLMEIDEEHSKHEVLSGPGEFS